MLAYGFKPVFAPQISTGAPNPKTLTLRRPRKPPSRHADVGEAIGLWTGMRSPEAKRQGVGLVVVRGLLRFDRHDVRHVSELRVHDAGGAFTADLQRDLIEAASDAIARRDGFENWASAWSWHDLHREKEERDAESIVRELIGWLPLDAAQIAGIDNGSARIEEVA